MTAGFSKIAAAASVAALVACGQGEPGGRTVIDTAGGAVIDSSRNVAQTVAATLTDENVIALMDSSYAAAIRMDTLAQTKASSAQLKAFVTKEIPEHNLILRASKDLTERLKVSPVLPDRDPLVAYRDAMRDLNGKTGVDWDRTYLDGAIKMHEELLDEVNDGLKGRQTEAVRTFLEQVRANIETDLKDMRGLRDNLK
jgi:predicted outer membrane protein